MKPVPGLCELDQIKFRPRPKGGVFHKSFSPTEPRNETGRKIFGPKKNLTSVHLDRKKTDCEQLIKKKLKILLLIAPQEKFHK